MAQSIVAWIAFCLSFGIGLAKFKQQPPSLEPPSQAKPQEEARRAERPAFRDPERQAIVRKVEAPPDADEQAVPKRIDGLLEPPRAPVSRKLDGPIVPASMTVPPDQAASPAAPVTPAVMKPAPRQVNQPTQSLAAAVIKVTVPPNATIWIEHQRMTQTGAQRSYISPPLEPGKTYAYTMKMSFPHGKFEVGTEREVIIHAGDTATVDFTEFAAQASRGGLVGEPQEKKPPIEPVRHDDDGRK
jgi:uncharacterized protein (TIGR03000 family)